MKAQRRDLRLAALAMTLTLLTGARASAEEPPPAQGAEPAAAQLQRNVHDIRLMLEREHSQLEGARRGNTGLVVDSRDAPGLGTMRQQLAQSLEKLGNRCFGIDMKVSAGNAIFICGNNNGTAEGSNTTSSSRTIVVVPSLPGDAPAPPAAAARTSPPAEPPRSEAQASEAPP